MFGKQMCAGPTRNNETERGILTDIAKFFTITSSSYYNVAIHGDRSLPGAVPPVGFHFFLLKYC